MQSLKNALSAALKTLGLENAVAQNHALLIWEDVVGMKIAKNTEPDRVEHGIIIVKVSSSTWRQELFFQKKEIVKKLNNKIGKRVIKDIRFI